MSDALVQRNGPFPSPQDNHSNLSISPFQGLSDEDISVWLKSVRESCESESTPKEEWINVARSHLGVHSYAFLLEYENGIRDENVAFEGRGKWSWEAFCAVMWVRYRGVRVWDPPLSHPEIKKSFESRNLVARYPGLATAATMCAIGGMIPTLFPGIVLSISLTQLTPIAASAVAMSIIRTGGNVAGTVAFTMVRESGRLVYRQGARTVNEAVGAAVLGIGSWAVQRLWK